MGIKGRPAWEVLIGSARKLDWLADPEPHSEHPLQQLLEEFVETELDEQEREVFYMRFGEQRPIRYISHELWGYLNIKGVQDILESIEEKAREFIDERVE